MDASQGYEDHYLASDAGNIKSLDRIVTERNTAKAYSVKGRMLKSGIKNNGYKVIVLCVKNKLKTKHVHSIVFQAFYGKEGNRKIVINHKNVIKTDNRLSNLELISKGDDIRHAYKMGLKLR